MPTSFTINIDESLLSLSIRSKEAKNTRHRLLSLVNGFEDGKWREEHFMNFVWDNMAETALSYREREALKGKSMSSLRECAKKLRLSDKDSDVGQGSEIAEIVLYGLMKDMFNALPVVPKIFYKQNAQDYAKGADSVHIVLSKDNQFTLWLGEAKFYNDIEDSRMVKIISSVMELLKTDKLKKENSIITSLSDLDLLPIEEEVKVRIREMLSTRESADPIREVLNIPIFLLHECELTADATELTPQYASEIKKYHLNRAEAYFDKQCSLCGNSFKYANLCFRLILFPVPSKKSIVDRFVSQVESFRS